MAALHPEDKEITVFIQHFTLAAALFASVGTLSVAVAQDSWPTQPVNLMIGAPPGGSMDVLARLIAAPLGKALDQPVVVLNRPGAGQVVSTQAAAAATDGHTVLLGTEGIALNVTLQPNYPDPREALDPLMLLTRSSLSIVAAPQAPYQNLSDVVEAAKARPGAIPYGSAGGTATLSNLIMVGLQAATGTQLLHVPYGGGAPAVQATMAGQTELTAGTSFLIQPQVDAGRLKALAVTSATRDPSLPSVPTLAESGYPDLAGYAWWGIFVPRSMPQNVKQQLHEELREIMQSPAMRDQLQSQGMEVVASPQAEFAKFFDDEIAKWGKLIADNNVMAGQ